MEEGKRIRGEEVGRKKEGEEESKLEIERGLEEDTLEERRFCDFFFLSRRPNTSCIGKVGKTDMGLICSDLERQRNGKGREESERL